MTIRSERAIAFIMFEECSEKAYPFYLVTHPLLAPESIMHLLMSIRLILEYRTCQMLCQIGLLDGLFWVLLVIPKRINVVLNVHRVKGLSVTLNFPADFG